MDTPKFGKNFIFFIPNRKDTTYDRNIATILT